MKTTPLHGIGLGLRFSHFDSILCDKPQTPWFEVIADDFLSPGPHHEKLAKLREKFPIVFHSVGMNIGGVCSLDKDYLSRFGDLYKKFEPAWISDHLCWSAHNGNYHHDLLPIPKTNEAFNHVRDRIQCIQEFFSREICIENITSYIDFKDEVFEEVDFLKELVKQTGCKLLLDISNVMINHKNRNKDPLSYFEAFPLESVKQVHLSGGTWDDGVLIDSHGESTPKKDIDILKDLIGRGLRAPAMIERDANVPDFTVLEDERVLIEKTICEVC